MGESYDCTHYERHCKLICAECDRAYVCRLCHDSAEEHNINRFAVTSVQCISCGDKQPKDVQCRKCGQLFGRYSCMVCSLYDDRDLGQFHCEGCRLCRVGGRENYTHCDTCCSCLPNNLAGKHQCIAGGSERQCPVCLDDIHSSRDTAHVPSCHHFLHSSCFEQLTKQKIFACPVCGKSMFEMTKQWEELDQIVRETPMPPSYRGVCCQVNCRDCNKESIVLFHVDGLKCKLCGSYNTSRSGGSFLRQKIIVQDAANSVTSPSVADTTENQNSAPSLNNFSTSNSSIATSEWNELPASPSSSSSSLTPVASISSEAPLALSMEVVTPAPVTCSSSGLPETFTSISSSSTTAVIASADTVSNAVLNNFDLSSRMSLFRGPSPSGSNRGIPGALTAQEEIHLYDPVSLEELEEDSSAPEEGGLAALLQGLMDGIHDIMGVEDVDDDDFSSFLSGGSTPPVVLSIQINGRDAELDEAEASDWVTDDEADDDFDTANSGSEQRQS